MTVYSVVTLVVSLAATDLYLK